MSILYRILSMYLFLDYRGNISCKTVLHFDKFPAYTSDKDIERRFCDISIDYDKSPTPTTAGSPLYPALNGVIYENGVGDHNGNTKTTLNSETLNSINRTGAVGLSGGGQLISGIATTHGLSGGFQLDRKFLQFTTDQVGVN